jgi:signal transduction histidine kinase
LITAQEDERQRISRELHDDIAQRLCVLALRLHTLGRELPEKASAVREHVRAAQRFTDEIAMDVHQLSRELHSSRLRNLGLRRSLESWCHEMSVQHGVTVHVTMNEVDDLPSDITLCVYRVVQEALNNAVKHGNAQQVSVDLVRDSTGVRMRIRDGGRGFDPEVAANGIGLASMRERLRFIGGDLTVKSAPGHGTELVAEIRFGTKNPSVGTLVSVSGS